MNYTKELESIKYHFKRDGWDLCYQTYLEYVSINRDDLDKQIKFIGDLLDMGLVVSFRFDNVVIRKIRK